MCLSCQKKLFLFPVSSLKTGVTAVFPAEKAFGREKSCVKFFSSFQRYWKNSNWCAKVIISRKCVCFPRLWLRYLTPNVLVPSPRPQRYAMLASATQCPNQRRRLLWRSLIHLEKRRVSLKMTSTLKFWHLLWTSGATITASTTVPAMTKRRAMNGGTQAGQSALRHA